MKNTDLENARQVRRETLELLRGHDGREWKEVAGELHAQFHEIPSWILLYDDSDIVECHNIFYNIVSPYFERLPEYEFTVKYIRINNGREEFLEFFADNQEISDAIGRPNMIGQRSIYEARSNLDTFRSDDSKR